MNKEKFIEAWDEIESECHNTAVRNGFWNVELVSYIPKPGEINSTSPFKGKRNVAECIALMHSELSEALEAIRKDDVKNLEEELADCVIRIMDFACGFRLNIPEAILKKIEFNKTRPYKHGKKF